MDGMTSEFMWRNICKFFHRTGKSRWVQGKLQESWGPFCKCESWRTLSQDLSTLGCEAKANSLHLIDWQLGTWAKWVSGRGREVSTTEQSEVRALWTGLSSPLSALPLESPHRPLTFWTNDGPRPPLGLLLWCPSEISMQQSSVTHTLSWRVAQLAGLKTGVAVATDWRVFEVFKKEVGLLPVVLFLLLITWPSQPDTLAISCFLNPHPKIIHPDACTSLSISATSNKPSDNWM